MHKKNLFILIFCIFCVMSSYCVYGEETTNTDAAETSVQTVSIEESFDIYSGLYNEKLADGSEFYSSVPNGVVVSDAVYFDVPTGLIDVDAELDGKKIGFNNKTLYTEKGYYILKFSSATVNNGNVAGVFTFRIGDRPQGTKYSLGYKYPAFKCTAEITADESGMYTYRLPNCKAFMTNIPAYGANTETAKFIIPRNMGYSFTKDGRALSLVNNRVYDEPGSYRLKVFGSSNAVSGGYEAYYETTLDFTVGSSEEESYIPDVSGVLDTAASYIPSLPDINIPSRADTAETPQYTPEGPQEELIFEDEEEVINDTLIETYFENAVLYAETFSSGNAFYTNTPNDGIVGGNVYIDIPSDMTVEMTKDGIPTPFENKTYINDEGSYNLVVTVESGTNVLSARYSFRIQYGTDMPQSVDNGEENTDNTAEYAAYDEDIVYDVENRYDSNKMMYVFDGGETSFYLSVPDGMITNEDVKAEVPEDVDVVLKKDGEEIPFTDNISGDGHYDISVGGNEVSFDIVGYSTNRFDSFVAPEGYIIAASEYDDMGFYDKSSDEYLNGVEMYKNSVSLLMRSMPLDGEYSFMLESYGDRSLPAVSITFVSDRTAPEVVFDGLDEYMSATGESVTVICDDPEAVLTLGEETLTLTDGKAEITGSGEYELTVCDRAGNKSEYTFNIGGEQSPTKPQIPKWLKTVVNIFLAIMFCVCIWQIIKPKLFGKKKKKNTEADNGESVWGNIYNENSGEKNDGWENNGDGEETDDWEREEQDDWETDDWEDS